MLNWHENRHRAKEGLACPHAQSRVDGCTDEELFQHARAMVAFGRSQAASRTDGPAFL